MPSSPALFPFSYSESDLALYLFTLGRGSTLFGQHPVKNAFVERKK